MSYNIFIRDTAIEDTDKIVRYYDDKQNGLGEQFLIELELFLE